MARKFFKWFTNVECCNKHSTTSFVLSLAFLLAGVWLGLSEDAKKLNTQWHGGVMWAVTLLLVVAYIYRWHVAGRHQKALDSEALMARLRQQAAELDEGR